MVASVLRLLVLGLATSSLLLAGCANTKGPAGPAAADLVGTGSGVLRGLVVDDAIRPVKGANVTVTGEGGVFNATSDANGLFQLLGLTPGAYLVRVSKPYYSAHEQAVVVAGGVGDPAIVRFQLVFEASSVPFAAVYKYEGYHECGFNFIRVCSNVNIATWIVLCQYHVCLGNVTSDHSLFLQPIDSKPTFIQAELVWQSTSSTGDALNFYIGGANGTELASGIATAFNGTGGPSPLMLRLSNHEGDSAWCKKHNKPPCGADLLNETLIGTERSLLGQVDAGATYPVEPLCPTGYCGVGFSAQQRFTMYTIVFYGYEPPADWLFAETGAPPPPPAPPA